MGRLGLIVIGVLLVALAVAWFFTPFGETMAAMISGEDAGGTRSIAKNAPGSSAAMDQLNTALNALNALFGAVGIYLTLKGLKPRT